MKYMGSKSALLRGPLGDLVLEEAAGGERFVDLFSGSGSVGHFVAESLSRPVLSADLQMYSKILAAVITERTTDLNDSVEVNAWLAAARASFDADPAGSAATLPKSTMSRQDILDARHRAAELTSHRLTNHYGGHYFALPQALALDHLLSALPAEGEARTLGLAAVLRAASICAAAPGHTAQPFQPTGTLLPYIESAWRRSVFDEVERQVKLLSPRFAKVRGQARVADAETVAGTLGAGDVAFCDPPYSSVQYSRFYHVLEGIARGGWDDVTGAGRAPARDKRASSDFSLRTAAASSLASLLGALRERSCAVIVTFPDADASNGLSADAIVAVAEDDWHVSKSLVDSTHSTLGGRSHEDRGGRRKLKEAVIVLRPRLNLIAVPWEGGQAPSGTTPPVPSRLLETYDKTEAS